MLNMDFMSKYLCKVEILKILYCLSIIKCDTLELRSKIYLLVVILYVYISSSNSTFLPLL